MWDFSLENGSLRLWLDLEEVKALHGGVCPPEREPEKSVEKEFEEDSKFSDWTEHEDLITADFIVETAVSLPYD